MGALGSNFTERVRAGARVGVEYRGVEVTLGRGGVKATHVFEHQQTDLILGQILHVRVVSEGADGARQCRGADDLIEVEVEQTRC